jgi:Holliday junction resolvase
MSIHRWASKRDGNEQSVIGVLRAQGFSVARVSGKGTPDWVVGKGPTFMRWVEIKQPKGRATEAQEKFAEGWWGPPPIVLRSIEDAQMFCLLAMEGGQS